MSPFGHWYLSWTRSNNNDSTPMEGIILIDQEDDIPNEDDDELEPRKLDTMLETADKQEDIKKKNDVHNSLSI